MTVPRSYLGLTRPWAVGLEEPGLQANPSLQNCLTRFKFRTQEVFFSFLLSSLQTTVAREAEGLVRAQWPACAPDTHAWPRPQPPPPGFQGSQLHQQPPPPPGWLLPTGELGLFCVLPAAAGSLPLPLLGQVRTLRPRGADQSPEGWLPFGQAQRLREGRPPGDHSPGSRPGLGMTKSGTLSIPQLE